MVKKSNKNRYLDRLLNAASPAYRGKKQYTEFSGQLKALQSKYDELLSKYNTLLNTLSSYNRVGQDQQQHGGSPVYSASGLDPRDPRLSSYDNSLNSEESGSIGDIYSNQIKAQLLKESEGAQAGIVGEEAGLEETLRRNVLEQKSLLYPIGLGADNKASYMPLSENKNSYLPLYITDVSPMKDKNGNYMHDKLTGDLIYNGIVEFRFRPREWFFHGYGAGLDKDGILNRVYAHAQNARVGFGNKFKRNWYNPHVEGNGFSINLHGPVRWNLPVGFFTGYRASLRLNGITAKKLKELMLAIDPRSGSERLYQEQNA